MNDDAPRRLARMRAVAGGLLLAMLALFLLAGGLQARWEAFAYVRAFAEAAMVGALADWFAVAALFRRPLGLPIPHTAVIPRNKERIGDSLGRFVAEHFLPPEVIRARLADVDLAARAAGWLADPDQAARLAVQITALLPALLAALDTPRLRAWVREQLTDRLQAVDLAPLAADLLAELTADDRHQVLLDHALGEIAGLIAEKEELLRQKIRDHTGWLWQKLSVDERAFNGIMKAVEELLREVDADPGHELRRRFDLGVRNFIGRLRESPAYRERGAALQREILANPALHAHLEGLWADWRGRLLADLASPSPACAGHLQALCVHLGRSLAADGALRAAANDGLRELLAELAESQRQTLAQLIPETMRTWDAETLSRRLELQVGRDLQFIRINGTLVGGLVGLAIYSLSRLFA